MAGSSIKEKIVAGARIIDVRTPAEFADGAYDGAINIPLSVLPARMNELEPKDKPIVLYCETGARSGHGARLLRRSRVSPSARAARRRAPPNRPPSCSASQACA